MECWFLKYEKVIFKNNERGMLVLKNNKRGMLVLKKREMTLMFTSRLFFNTPRRIKNIRQGITNTVIKHPCCFVKSR
ncbi:hypothetical protein Sjap_013865 [Stephania japonica]|uniref:Uncharacterized protein n=1 Tax=Stephania japonica TaxID=461633 RepID=A0AAP0J0I7_9MAGN